MLNRQLSKRLVVWSLTLVSLPLTPGRAAAARRAKPGQHRVRIAGHQVTTRTAVHRRRALPVGMPRANRRPAILATRKRPFSVVELITPPSTALTDLHDGEDLRDAAEPGHLTASTSASDLPARQPAIPLVWGLSLPSVEPPRFAEPTSDAPWPLAPLAFIGVVEAPGLALRLAVFNVNGRVVYGRVGDVIADHYRVRAFSDQLAEVLDTASDAVLRALPPQPTSTPPTSVPAASSPQQVPPPETGTLRLVGQPGQAPIYIDGIYAGTIADLSEAPGGLSLEAGVHHLELRAPESQPVEIDIRIDPNRTTTYNVAVAPPRRQP